MWSGFSNNTAFAALSSSGPPYKRKPFIVSPVLFWQKQKAVFHERLLTGINFF
ncbi:hypothetical protein ESA_03937 [Cronobacter sakazakii ATCC BAA-894]|uniref:Uncharacterized protein n=1 Tax=Cronobacter sakazakii (strain ATCC BAA-894) TaxID=290339 RepID=A7MQ17_CROS8|nr:hypothetical protein ESA_03937 [Cronobacter sakazakii ATCC BAA-894]